MAKMDLLIAKNRNVLALFLLLGIAVFTLFRLFNFDGLYGQDPYAYIEHAQVLKSFLLGGGKPPMFFWPINYPLFAAFIDLLINDLSVTLQVLSILSWSLIGYFSYATILQQFPGSNRTLVLWFIICFVSFAPYLFRFSGCAMSDELTTLFVLLCFKHALDFKSSKSLQLTIVFGALAIFTRYGAIVLIAIPIGYTFYYKIKSQPFWFYPTTLVLLFVIALPYIYFNGIEIGSTLQKSVTSDWSVTNWFQVEFESPEGLFIYDYPNILYAAYAFLHPAFMFLGAPLLIFAFYQKIKLNNLILISVVIYLLFIAGIHFQNKRFFVLSIPLVSIVMFPIFEKLMAEFKSLTLRRSIYTGILVINLVLSVYTTSIVVSISRYETKVISQLVNINEKMVYTFEIDVAMKGRGLTNEYINLWENDSISPKPGSLMIINTKRWEKQWASHHLMKHCRIIETSNQYSLNTELMDGWKIYEKL